MLNVDRSLAYRAGVSLTRADSARKTNSKTFHLQVTVGVTAPSHRRFFGGLGTSFSTGASHKLEEGAIVQTVTAVHVSIRHFSKPSVSTQIAALRRLLLGPYEGAVGDAFSDVVEVRHDLLWHLNWCLTDQSQGRIPLVVEAHSADVIATLIVLKKEVEVEVEKEIRLTITGGAEAHLLAKEIAEANVGVILNPSRPFPYVWEDRRMYVILSQTSMESAIRLFFPQSPWSPT